MRIDFDDGGYVEFCHSKNNKIFIIVAASSSEKPSDKIINSAEITQEQFMQLVSEFIQKKKQAYKSVENVEPSNLQK
jgi:hypothetical protein